MDDPRKLLNGKITLYGENEGRCFSRTFYIDSFINAGGTVICYSAHLERSGKGVLREFYPIDALSLERSEDGSLVHTQGDTDSRRRFEEKKERYLESYLSLLTAIRRDRSDDLATFIPAFEIYSSRPSMPLMQGKYQESMLTESIPDTELYRKGDGTIYIWSPDPKVKTFEEVCCEIHKNITGISGQGTGHSPEEDLLLILNAVKKLTECIRKLHLLYLVHRDIKPENFGFKFRGGRILPDTVTLFDIDSLCSVLNKPDTIIQSDGYTEPELLSCDLSNQMDIYSIGATLFRALVYREDQEKIIYDDLMYEQIGTMLENSPLISSAEANSHPKLVGILTNILKKSLAPRRLRYRSSSDLLNDIDDALFYVLPFEIAAKNYNGEKWVLKDVHKANLEEYIVPLQYHVYQYPIYKALHDGRDKLSVSIFGFGKYSQAFLDIALQGGQIWGRKLSVTVYSDPDIDRIARKSNRDLYFERREGLSLFFNVDGCDTFEGESYGDIQFSDFHMTENRAELTGRIQEILLKTMEEGNPPEYVFVSLGNDDLNDIVAEACLEAGETLDLDMQVHYVIEDRVRKYPKRPSVYPVYVRKDYSSSKEIAEIERMAFNTHLLWEKDLNIDFTSARNSYNMPYNHQSCVGMVLSIKSKLFSLGIDLDALGFLEAAAQYDRILHEKGEEAENRLIYIEHRRWVTGKLCAGYKDFDNLNDCVAFYGKDEKGRRHCCMKRSRPDQLLLKNFQEDSFRKWDEGSNSALNKLDDLDRMSVELHRAYRRIAESAKTRNILNGDTVDAINFLIENNNNCIAAFQEWYVCMKDLLSGDRSRVYIYGSLKRAFTDSAESLSYSSRAALLQSISDLDNLLKPVIRSLEYRDYKQEDIVIVKNIPFILTYSANLCVCIPYMTGGRSDLFRNAASAVVLHPSSIIYMVYLESRTDYFSMRDTLPYAIAFMKKKNVMPDISFLICCGKDITGLRKEEIKDDLISLLGDRQGDIQVFENITDDTVTSVIDDYLNHEKKSKGVLLLERNTSVLGSILRGTGTYGRFSSFEFDPAAMNIKNINDCSHLLYIRKRPHISVADMAAFNLTISKANSQPEFYKDYLDLWRKYKSNKNAWKMLCDDLQKHAEAKDIIATFSVRKDAAQTDEIKYILPIECCRTVKKILRFMKDNGLAGNGSVKVMTTDTCELTIRNTAACREDFDRLFSDPYVLEQSDDIELVCRKHHPYIEAEVRHKSLIVRNAVLDEINKNNKKDLLRYFEGLHYIYNLNIKENSVSFVYAGKQIRQLLTMAGRILEIYVYHRVKAAGMTGKDQSSRFDDLVSGYEINWEGTEVKSEFDCIVTKGFTMLFIECKARKELSQDFYNKLSGLAIKFGINAKAVLIADTDEKNSRYDRAEQNMLQRKRGSMMEIITVWKQEEIDQIEKVLFEISDGQYVQKEWGD